jgi:hypothetical protein
MPHGRRLVAWLCIAAALLLPLGAQLHATAHALKSLQQASHSQSQAPHAQGACDDCLLFAAIGAAAPAHAVVPQFAAAAATATQRDAPLPRPEAFTAYASRAPPRAG